MESRDLWLAASNLANGWRLMRNVLSLITLLDGRKEGFGIEVS